jgi:hypothetical protein
MLEGVNGGPKVSNSGEIKLSTCQSPELKSKVMYMIDVEEFLMARVRAHARVSAKLLRFLTFVGLSYGCL